MPTGAAQAAQSGPVYAVVVDDSGNFYIGGNFTSVGIVAATNIAKWDGSTWSPLGSGVGGTVTALAVSGSDVYAGGGFGTAGDSSAANIAKWDGNAWSPLGSGISGYVYALAVSGTNVYVGGDFNKAGGNSASDIAKWDGSSWSAVGNGVAGGQVFGLAVSGSDVYACGAFVTASSACCTAQVNGIARWDGTAWWALPVGANAGMNNWVTSVAVSGGYVYAGGFFNYAGGNQINGIAKWDGNTWSALGSGLYGQVFAIAVSGTNLYAGGGFSGQGGFPPINIGNWNGSSWSSLSSGVDGTVYGLALSGTNLYAGGTFSTAGGKPSPYVARAVLGDAPGFNQLAGKSLPSGDVQLSYIGCPATNYALDRALNLSAPIGWVGQQTNTIGISGVLMFTNTPMPGTNNFWRVRSAP